MKMLVAAVFAVTVLSAGAANAAIHIHMGGHHHHHCMRWGGRHHRHCYRWG